MNNKEFTLELSQRVGCSTRKTSELIAAVVAEMTQSLEEGDVISLQGFGSFEVKKKAERISVSPTTKQKMLVPPKLSLTFRPSSLLKEKFKNQF